MGFRRIPHVIYATQAIAANTTNVRITDTSLINNLAGDFELLEFSLEARLANGTAVADHNWRIRVKDTGINTDLTKVATNILVLLRSDTRRWDVAYTMPTGAKIGHLVKQGGGALQIDIDNLDAANAITVHIGLHGFLIESVS